MTVLLNRAYPEQLPVKTYTTADGLGSSFVSDILRDSHGFMWFCTRDGLSRFDGARFVTYQVGERDAPPGIEQILETRAGIYWIGTTGGLYRFDPGVPVTDKARNAARPALNAQLMGDQRGTLYEDHNGNLWSGGDGLYLLEERDGKVSSRKIELNLPAKQSVQFNIIAIREGRDESLWLATSWGLVRRLPDGGEVLYSVGDSRTDVLNSLIEDRTGRIWVTQTNQIYILKPESPPALSRPGSLSVRKLDDAAQTRSRPEVSLPEAPGEIYRYRDVKGFAESASMYLYETTDGHVWMSVADGVVEFDGRAFLPHTSAQGLLKGSGVLAEDASGNLWVGGVGGLTRLDRHGLTTFNAADELKNSPVFAIGESPEDKLYVGVNGFVLGQFDGHGFQTLRMPLAPDEEGIWLSHPVFQDHAGEWWFLTNKHLYRYAATRDFKALARSRPRAVYTSRDGLKADQMFCIFEDSKGDLWISTRGPDAAQVGLSRWRRADEKFETFSEAEGFPTNKSPSAFAEDGEGNLWFGFYSGGLARYARGRFTEFTDADGVPGGVVTALHSDRQGRLWVATALSGLGRVDDVSAARPRFVAFTTDNGLASNNVRSITEDLYGNIYAGTARGVDRLSPDGARVRHYSVRDGLAADFVNAAFRDRTGALWFGTPNGLSRLVPQTGAAAGAPPVWLGALHVAGESRPLPELGSAEIAGLDLSPAQNNLQIDFFGIDFEAGETLRYQYMLEGADKNWGAPTTERAVSYAQLAPGRYRFLVRAVNADGVVGGKSAQVVFTIRPPTWQRWWFIALVLTALAGALYALFRYRLAQLLKIERVRSRIATDLHDDIGASLSKIAILSEVVHQRIAPIASDDKQINEPLDVIAGTSREMVDSMSDIVWAINPAKDHLSDLIGRMRNLAGEMTELCDIGLRVHLSGVENGDLHLGTDLRREVYLIFKETLNNLVRHSDCERAEIEFRLEGDWLIIKVKDDGRGFDVKAAGGDGLNGNGATRGGNGLINMRRRAKNLGGVYEIESGAGRGTTTTLRVPLKTGRRRLGLSGLSKLLPK